MNESDALLVTIAGPDRPGITATFAALLAEAKAQVLDVEQAVVEGYLTLLFLIALDEPSSKGVLKDLLWKAREVGLQLEFRPVRAEARPRPAQTWAVTMIKPEIGADVLARAAQAAATHGFNIEKIARLSRGRLSSLELILGGSADADPAKLRSELVRIEAELGCDVALQKEGLLRRSKRLVVLDMDSTLIQQEVIDELARTRGVYDQVAHITHRAMNGELDFEAALRERVKLLAGAPESVFEEVLAKIELTPGADNFVRVLKRLGYRIAVISGGFIQVTEPIRRRLGLDYGFANELEVIGGRLTGNVIGPIITRRRKADLLESLAQMERISLEQVIAVGDGANDLDMLARAGLGIAFNAKRAVQEQARYRFNQQNLDAVLYLLGIRDEDITELTKLA
ncbi:phosphoserine phosphatase SerB [Myxococcota bacterium]|nr:phosphoserine phosphatase SerB [Myxococcota bacterium]